MYASKKLEGSIKKEWTLNKLSPKFEKQSIRIVSYGNLEEVPNCDSTENSIVDYPCGYLLKIHVWATECNIYYSSMQMTEDFLQETFEAVKFILVT